jgi:hypothetical protein
MILNAPFWSNVFQSEFIPRLEAIPDVLERLILPGFEDIENESNEVSRDTWERFMSAPGTGNEDPANFAELAEQAGVSHYLLMDGIRQGMLNLFTVALYHAFEQQIMVFHRKEVLHPAEVNTPAFLKFSEFKLRLLRFGIDIETFSSWRKVDELRTVANAVKHAEGNSTRKLHSIRPEMFENPHSINIGLPRLDNPPIFQPLVGDDLYVSLQDIKNYCAGLTRFWQELSATLAYT